MATVIDTDLNRYEVVQVKNYLGTPLKVIQDSSGAGEKTTAYDAFNRLRVSNPFTLFDSQHRYQENDKWDTSLSGSASKTYTTNDSAVNLILTTASGDSVIRETKRVFPYQPGKSLLVMNTFVMATPKAGLRQRVGYFGTQNGVYFETSGTTLYIVKRSYVTGSVVETRVAQSDWNGDKFNGTGLSGRILDPSKSQVLWTDIEWLGVGDMRVGFIVDGIFVTAHTFHHDNVEPTSYMTTAILPCRYEITNTSSTASSSTLKQICSTVISEGGYEGFSRRYNINIGSTPKTLSTAGTTYPIISLRLNSTRIDSVVLPSNINGISTSNQDLQYHVYINPTLTGANWVTHFNNNVQYDISATALTGGTEIVGGYIKNSGQIDLNTINEFNFQLGRTLAGVSDIITLALTPISNNTNTLVDFSWFEIV